ncbi:hypothetical protein B0H10DRAFT_2230061 [Mycena sp. CBHHK59/15]|nr:hypothetical protein B0H10DRAFT_2230061 [Mycena sp. CBHHK59/15]
MSELPSKHTPADREFLDSVSARQLMEFRNHVYSPAYIELNAGKFLDHEWVDISGLKQYLRRQTQNSGPAASTTHPFALSGSGSIASTRLSAVSDPVRVKIEATATPASASLVKAEPQVISIPQSPAQIKMRTLNEDGQEVFELLSDSEADTDGRDSDLEVMEALQRTSRSSSTIPPCVTVDADDCPDDESECGDPSGMASSDPNGYESDNCDESDLVESDTVWQDNGTSRVRIGQFRPTRKTSVERMEYRAGPAAVYPIHRVRTGIVVDLSDEKYRLRDPTTKKLYSLMSIIINADNDSWDWGGGGSRARAKVTFAPGETPVDCRRIRCDCKGAYACDQLDPALRDILRFELDSGPRNAIIAAQQETRRREGNTAEERVVLFMKVIRDAKCRAVDTKGNKCRGGPILKPKPHGSERNHQYFVGCSGWTPKFQQGHRTHPIPDNVDEDLLANALAGRPLTDDPAKDTLPCSGIIHPHTGLKKEYCSHAHIANGMQVRGEIKNYPCKAVRYVYVPKDPSIRKVLIVHNNTGHTHPIPTLSNVSFELNDTYRQCIKAHGVLGATVSKIDNAQSTKMLLDGKTPSAYAPPLHNKRVKRDLLRAAKLEEYPHGLDVEAIIPIAQAELLMPLPERYIHSYIKTKQGKIIIVTFVPYLLKLLDDSGVTSFDGDTTYKGIVGKVNEWELTIFAKVVQRAASILRAYIDGASTDFFEELFDELQRVKLMVTGRPIPLKKFVRGSNLIVANVDMDGAQVLGFCRAVMKYNDPEYSGFSNDTPPEEIAPEIIKLCWRHGKEPIHDFKSLVTPQQLARIKNVFYIQSKEELAEFSTWLYGLGIKKITDWWKHKEINDWIIPCLIKSQSNISADDWDATPSTTNTNEAQHHWTNSHTGTKLPPVEALESRRKLDLNTAQEIEMSLRTGILSNPNNDISHRMSRNSRRQAATAEKEQESRDAAKPKAKASSRRGKSTRAGTTTLSASSSGRVKTQGRPEPSPVLPTQSDTVSPEPIVSPLPTQTTEALVPDFTLAGPAVDPMFDLFPTFDFRFNDTTISQGFNAPGSFPSHEFPDTPFDPNIFGLTNYNAPITSEPGFSGDHFTPPDPTLFGLSADFNAQIPSGAPVEDPLQDFMALFGPYGIPGDVGMVSDIFSASTESHLENQLPLLPPPPPASPVASPAIDNAGPSAPKSRRSRHEVDEANILTSARSRAPTERKRIAEEEVSSRAQKRNRRKRDQCTASAAEAVAA